MNYRHAFHAGNFADIVKHAVLALALAYLKGKDTPLRVIDSHAGAGLYDLGAAEAARTGEWRGGIGRLWDAALPDAAAAALAPLMRVVRDLNPGGELRLYPGSPEIARRLARPQDRLLFCEAREDDRGLLAGLMAGDRRAKVLATDGWVSLKAYLPPPERRGIVLVDPPFEAPGEFDRMRGALGLAAQKWPGGTYLLWYPVKDIRATDAFARAAGRCGLDDVWRLEMLVRSPRDASRLNGTGLILVNPPWTLADDLAALMPALTDRLADGDGARWRYDRLSPARPRK